MCIHLNEGQTHPLELRVHALEQLLEEAIMILQSKVSQADCSLVNWIDGAEEILNERS